MFTILSGRRVATVVFQSYTTSSSDSQHQGEGGLPQFWSFKTHRPHSILARWWSSPANHLLQAPRLSMPHQDIARGFLRPMGSQPKKVDFQGDPKVGQRPYFFVNTPPRPNFLLGPCLCQAGPYFHLCKDKVLMRTCSYYL